MLTVTTMHTRNHAQAGVILLEALLGLLIFSLGILAMIGMQAQAIATSADAQYRGEGTSLASQVVSLMWVNVDRANAATLAASLNNFRYNTAGANCNFSGGATDPANAVLSNWVTAATSTAGTRLPGATAAMLQVNVDTSVAGANLVTVIVCWKAPADTQTRSHILTANVT